MLRKTNTPLSKKAREEHATAIVDALGEIEILWNKSLFCCSSREVFASAPKGCVRPSGDTDLELETSFKFTNVSSHDQIAIQNRRAEFKRIFEKIGAGLAALFPGQPLSWKFNFGMPSRHSLYLGYDGNAPSKTGHYILSTARSRWKAPLLRLADFFNEACLYSDMTLHEWCFLRGEVPGTPTGVIGSIPSTIMTARSFSEALRLSAFRTPDTRSTPEPTSISDPLMYEIGLSWPALDLDASLMDDTSEAHSEVDRHVKDLESALEDKLPRLISAFLSLNAELSLTATCNLISNDVQIDAVNHPLVSRMDLSLADRKRETLRNVLQEITSLLTHALRKVHPDGRDIRLTARVERTTETTTPRPVFEIEIDGLRYKTLAPVGFPSILYRAAQVAFVMDPAAPRRLFLFGEPSPANSVRVNINTTPTLIHATTPEHAWLLYSDRADARQQARQGAHILEIEPVARSEWEISSESTNARISRIYKK